MGEQKGERATGQKQEPGKRPLRWRAKRPVGSRAKRPPWWRRLWAWTGFGERKLWDWLQLLSALAIPIVLAVAGFLFTSQQEDRQRRLEEQRAQDTALQAYLDQMSQLLLEKNMHDPAATGARTLARARSSTVLGRLDLSRIRIAC